MREIAELLDLGPMLAARASGLTADGKQKISLGRGLVRSDVNVIMLDEPLTVIDPHLKWRLRSKLKELHQRIGLTMVYVTHDQTEAMTFADQVVVMHEGTVVQAGTPVELFERPRHTFVGHFIGSPGMNILPCEVVDGVARFAGQPVRTANAGARPPAGARTEIGVRPEFVRFAATGIPVRRRPHERRGTPPDRGDPPRRCRDPAPDRRARPGAVRRRARELRHRVHAAVRERVARGVRRR